MTNYRCRLRALPRVALASAHAWLVIAVLALLLPGWVLPVCAQEFIPRRQTRPPGAPLSPAEAIARMTVPPGFHVELVAAEPDIVNPVAMAFDERGRIWITESFEYPRSEPGAGRDRVKILEDTNGDGRADKVTVFAEGLNIPSGIAVGAGGVWVANAPDILLLEDTDGDDRADRQEVVVTGFGRTDTHELPNSLTWGPDGWLYGLNGVFNHCHVKHRGREFKFNCALFRIHPRTRDFELFAEGTSNPWGIAWDTEGSAFVSACVIDHLWHLVETGYYHRQGGPYPPFTWKIDSIVEHKHQLAAYCGIHFFDSDAYPAQYREKLYMGNIHGNCINSDAIRRDGSTYLGTPEPDFLSAGDVWFMPVVQKTGPDGCLYVLDWYDRYHCYQDARHDPSGVDRGHGRLYRIRYGDSPRAAPFDLRRESLDDLIARLASPNVFFRDMAQRLLWERGGEQARAALESLVLDTAATDKARLHGLWALLGSGPLEETFHLRLLEQDNSVLRAWAVRAAGNQRQVAPPIRRRIVAMAADAAPDVRLQVAVAARKLADVDAVPLLVDVLAHSDGDRLIPQIVWQNLHPLLEEQGGRFLAEVRRRQMVGHAALAALAPRACERLLAAGGDGLGVAADLLELLAETGAADTLASCLDLLAARIQNREVSPEQAGRLRPRFERLVEPLLADGRQPVERFSAALLASTWGHGGAAATLAAVLASSNQPPARRLRALESLVAARHPAVLAAADGLLAAPKAAPLDLRRRTLDALARLDEPRVAEVVLARYEAMEPELRPQAIELLTARAAWSKQLLAAIAAGRLPASTLNVNQVRKLLAGKDSELAGLVEATWGTLRQQRSPEREQVIVQMRELLESTAGDPRAGQAVFQRVCGQCHKIYGQGQEVGPDITVNGRGSFEQLLSNVFDPSLVVGAAYQAYTVVTTDGRVLSGLLAEDSPQRVVLKVQGGKFETIARGDVDEMEVSRLSMMPEGVEKQLTPQELADLFAFLSLDRPPDDPQARPIPAGENPAAAQR